MADKTYIYSSVDITAGRLAPILAPGANPTVVPAAGPAVIAVTIDEANKVDLDAAMGDFGFAFVSEQNTTDPAVCDPNQPIEVGAAVGDFVYWNAANARYERASAASSTTSPTLGIVAAKPTATTASVRNGTHVDNMADDGGLPLTPGSAYYLSAAVAGKITSVAPSGAGQTIQKLGVALTAELFLFSVPFDGLLSTAPADVTKAVAAAGTSTQAARADHKHDVSTAAPGVGIGGGNSEGAATSLARSDHGHALRTTTGPTDLTIAGIADGEVIRRTGATIAGGVGKRYPAAAANPVAPAPADGDSYFNTTLEMEMRYDGSRGKWLSVADAWLHFGRFGNTAPGSFFDGPYSIPYTADRGLPAAYNGTVVAIAFTRDDTDAATVEVTRAGAAIAGASLASAAIYNASTTINADFGSGAALGVKNQDGGNTVTNLTGWVQIKWRA